MQEWTLADKGKHMIENIAMIVLLIGIGVVITLAVLTLVLYIGMRND